MLAFQGLEQLSIEFLASESHKSHLLKVDKVDGKLSNFLDEHPQVLAGALEQGLHGGVSDGLRVVPKQAVDVLLHPLHHKLVQGLLHACIDHLDRNKVVTLNPTNHILLDGYYELATSTISSWLPEMPTEVKLCPCICNKHSPILIRHPSLIRITIGII